MNEPDKTKQITDRAYWNKARPRRLPRPAYWPFFLAMGVAFLAWGLLTRWLITAAGLVLMAVALSGWITELRHERRQGD